MQQLVASGNDCNFSGHRSGFSDFFNMPGKAVISLSITYPWFISYNIFLLTLINPLRDPGGYSCLLTS